MKLIDSIHNLQKVLEDIALSANLAPYPTPTIATIVVKKKKDKDEKKQEHNS